MIMQFSVVIPTYNYGHCLPNALDSILKQEITDFEIVILDDGSIDNTATVVDKYVSTYPNKIHYFKQNNQGLGRARNQGVLRAKGDYVLFLDADDRLCEHALSAFHRALEDSNYPDTVVARHVTIKGNNKKRESRHNKLVSNGKQNFLSFLRRKLAIAHGAFIAKRSVFSKLQYAENMIGMEDTAFLALLLANHSAVAINDITVEIISHNDSLRHQFRKQTEQKQLEQKQRILHAIFDEHQISKDHHKYRNEYDAMLCLSFSRQSFLARDNKLGRKWYLQALKKNPLLIFKIAYLRKFIYSFFRE